MDARPLDILIAVLSVLLAMTVVAVFSIGITVRHARAEALPYPKGHEQCAGSYVQSGDYCTPKSGNAAPAVPKRGQCPSGWFQSGGSCQKMR